MYTLTNKVTGLMQKGELKGDVIILEDGSQVPVSFDPGDTISSKVYFIGKSIEGEMPSMPSSPVELKHDDELDVEDDEDEEDEDLDEEN
jgi:hypothetical protein